MGASRVTKRIMPRGAALPVPVTTAVRNRSVSTVWLAVFEAITAASCVDQSVRSFQAGTVRVSPGSVISSKLFGLPGCGV